MHTDKRKETQRYNSRASANRSSDGLGHGMTGPVAVQRKLSIHGNKIDKHDQDIKIFSGAKFSKTLADTAQIAGQSLVNVQQKIDAMANDHLTHVFWGKVGEQKSVLADFMKYNVGLPLPRNYDDLKALRNKLKPNDEKYILLATIREDRPSGIASTEELGISRNKEGEASLKGFSTQVVDTPKFDYDDIGPNAELHRTKKIRKADTASIEKGIEDRVPMKHPSDSDNSAVALGLGSDVEGTNKKLRTKIRWAPAVSNEGTHMIADPLGPDHLLGSVPGSSSGENAKPWSKARKRMEALTKNNEKYIAGHLLNEQLGGPGDDVRNLAPISSEANAQHKVEVENEVKRAVNKDLLWMYYEVHTQRSALDPTQIKNFSKANWGDGMYTSSFKCDWGQLNEDGQRIDKKTVTLNFTDPTKSAGGKLNTNTTLVGKGSDSSVPLIPNATGARATRDFRRVILNTALKTKSYLIAAQTLLPEYEKVSGHYHTLSDEWKILQSVLEAYDPDADILDDELEAAEQYYAALEEAVNSQEAMDNIYASNLNEIDEFIALSNILSNRVQPAVQKHLLKASQQIDTEISKANGKQGFINALEYVKKLLLHITHPTEKAIQGILGQFVKAHNKEVRERLLEEREYSSKLEKERDDLEEGFDILEDDYFHLKGEMKIIKSQDELKDIEIDDLHRQNQDLKLRLAKSENSNREKDQQLLTQQLEMEYMRRQMEEQRREIEQLKQQLRQSQPQNNQQPSMGFPFGSYPSSPVLNHPTPLSNTSSPFLSHSTPQINPIISNSNLSNAPQSLQQGTFSFGSSFPTSFHSSLNPPKTDPTPFFSSSNLSSSRHSSPKSPRFSPQPFKHSQQGSPKFKQERRDEPKSPQERSKMKRSWDSPQGLNPSPFFEITPSKKVHQLPVNFANGQILAQKIWAETNKLNQQQAHESWNRLMELLTQFYQSPSVKNWALVLSLLEHIAKLIPDPVLGWYFHWKSLEQG